MEQTDDGFFNVFWLNMCPPRTIAFLVPAYVMFIEEILIESFAIKEEFQ